jgi:hypothetical protein
MPELGPEARRAIDRHLDSVGDHLVAVMWEMAFAIVRSSEQRAEAARAAGVDNLVERLRSEAQRIADDLTRLRERSSAAVAAVGAPPAAPAAPPAPEVEEPGPSEEGDATWTPTDGLAPEPIEDEPDEGSEPAELPEPDPAPEPEAEQPEPAQPSGRGRRASMHDNPVWSLFHRTEEAEAAKEEAKPESPPQPEAKPERAPEAPGNRKLMELARAVELAGAPPPPEDEEEPD